MSDAPAAPLSSSEVAQLRCGSCANGGALTDVNRSALSSRCCPDGARGGAVPAEGGCGRDWIELKAYDNVYTRVCSNIAVIRIVSIMQHCCFDQVVILPLKIL